MKNGHKVILVKAVIALSGILMLFSIIFGIVSEMRLLGKYNKIINDIAYILLLLFVISTILMIILITKIDIRPQKTKSKKYKLKINNYEQLKRYLFDKLINMEYDPFKTFEGELYNIDYAIKNNYRKTYIIALMKIKELTEEIYEKYKENYFEDFGNCLIENNEVNVTDDIHVIYVICVDKVTPIFSKYTESNVKQYFGRYNLPVGVSFGSNTLYISTQKEGYAKNKWRKLSKDFYEMIEEKIDND